MKNGIKRKYSMTDEVILKRSEVLLMNVEKDHALFIAKFPWLDDAYLITFQNDIDAAGNDESDETVVTGNKVKGNKQPIMNDAAKNLRTLFKYAAIAYPANRKKQRRFGQSRMAIARNNIARMITLLEHAHAAANKNPYKNDLLNKGYTQAEIDKLQTIATSLNDQHSQHQTAQTSRPVSTADRITLLNAAFDHVWMINKCARVVFKNNPAKIKLYKIYP